MPKKGDAQARLGLDYSAWETGAKAVKKIGGEVASFMRDTFAVAIGTTISGAFFKATSAAKGFAVSIKDNVLETIKAGEEMANFSHTTGIAAGQFRAFQFAMEKGVSNTTAAKIIGNNAELLGRNANIFRDVSIRLAAVGERIKGFWLGLSERVAPSLNLIFDKISTIDFSKWGQQIGDAFGNAFDIFVGLIERGTIWEALSIGFKLALAELLNGLVVAAKVFVNILQTGMKNIFDRLSDKIADIGDDIIGIDKNGNAIWGKFGGSAPGDLASQITEALKTTPYNDIAGAGTLRESLEKLFNDARSNSRSEEAGLRPFENTNARQNFGVSSLAAIGGGGGVGPGSLIDHAARLNDIQTGMARDVRQITDAMRRYEATEKYGPFLQQLVPAGLVTITD